MEKMSRVWDREESLAVMRPAFIVLIMRVESACGVGTERVVRRWG